MPEVLWSYVSIGVAILLVVIMLIVFKLKWWRKANCREFDAEVRKDY